MTTLNNGKDCITNGHSKESEARSTSRFFTRDTVASLRAFQTLCSQSSQHNDYPLATSIQSNIPGYDLASSNLAEANTSTLNALQDEWHHVLLHGPGVLVLEHFQPDIQLLRSVNATFDQIISQETESGTSRGDHFAAAGTNSRIWNSFQKHALRAPYTFVKYYSNPWLALIADAWLGPMYRITAQVNIVRPGGSAQTAHRDYHLGFQSGDSIARFPKSTQVASQFLTLQGGVAHSHMPHEAGPTRFLPFSQKFEEGFMAYRLPEFQRYFDQHWVSVPLRTGDAVFFNPVLFHAAGENTTTAIERSANLLQISSAFGKPMETVETSTIIGACWEGLKELYVKEGSSMTPKIQAVMAAVAEAYPFPTNLDKRPPAPGGMAPESELDIVARGLEDDWTRTHLLEQLKRLRDDTRS